MRIGIIRLTKFEFSHHPLQSGIVYKSNLNISCLTLRPLKLACHEFYTCTRVHGYVQYSTLKLSNFCVICFLKFRVLYGTVVRWSLVVNSDCKRNVWSCIYFLYQDTLLSQRFSIFKSYTSFQHDLWSIRSYKVDAPTKRGHLCGNWFWGSLQRGDYKIPGKKENCITDMRRLCQHKEMRRCCWNYCNG